MSEDGNNSSNLNLLNWRPETKKMVRYMPISISITRCASFLAWTGMVTSIIFSIASLDVIFTPLAMGFAHVCHLYSHCGIMYGVGVPVLVINIGMFIYCFKLWGTIRLNDMSGMRNLVKIGCYIMGGLELTVCAAGVITPLLLIIELNLGYPYIDIFPYINSLIYLFPINGLLIVPILIFETLIMPLGSIIDIYLRYPNIDTFPYINSLLAVPIVMFAVLALFITSMLHGVRKFKITLVKVNIIFKIVLFVLLVLRTLISTIMSSLNYPRMGGTVVLMDINFFLLYSFFYIYYNSYIVLQYNLMLGNMTEK